MSNLNLQHLVVFGREKPTYTGLIFGLNSPLQPIFRKATFRFRETGKEELLMKRWMGDDINEDWPVEKMVLTTGQSVTAFVLILLLYFFCLVIFLGEMLMSFSIKKIRKM